MTSRIETINELESLYGTPATASLVKVARRMTPLYRQWIGASNFCVLTTVGTDGTDGSPRGDDGPVVRELDPGTLAMPDWRGNNRMDSLRNIVTDGRVSLMFLVPGSTGAVRVNGRGYVSAEPDLLASFERNGAHPRTVIVIEIGEIYFQCARAILRSGLWSDDGQAAQDLPSAGQMLAEMSEGAFDGAEYDAAWPGRAAKTMW